MYKRRSILRIVRTHESEEFVSDSETIVLKLALIPDAHTLLSSHSLFLSVLEGRNENPWQLL